MSGWQTSHAEWLAWAREAVVGGEQPTILDPWDAQLCRALEALPFGQTTETTSVSALAEHPSPSAESMPTMVRAAHAAADGDDDVDAAETLVHGERSALIGEPLEVSLESPRSRLEVSLEPVPPPPPAEDAQWYIPPLTQRSQGGPPPASGAVETTIRGPAPAPAAAPAAAPAPPPEPAPPRAVPSAAEREAAVIRTGNTLIPIEPEAASTQTAGVIVTEAEPSEEPAPPPPRRSSKVVVAAPTESTAPPEMEADDVLESSDLLESDEPTLPPPSAPPTPPSPPPRTGEVARASNDAAASSPPPPPPPHEPVAPSAGVITGQTLPPTAARHWSEAVFASHYAALARPSAPAVAAAEAAFIAELVGLSSSASVLDVGCGEGLHANAFAERGCRTVGLDAAQPMLDLAVEEFGPSVPRLRWLCRDVRSPGFDETFDLVTCLGTTFGIYDEAENRAVLAALRRHCASNGRIVIQVANRDYVVPRLPARTWWQGRGCLVLDEVDVNDRTSRVQVKRTIVFEDGRQFEHHYSVRVYSLHELVALVEAAGLGVVEVSGSRHTRGRFFGATSPDIWLVATRV